MCDVRCFVQRSHARTCSITRRSTSRNWRQRKTTVRTVCSRRWADVHAAFRQQRNIQPSNLETLPSGAVMTTWAWPGIRKFSRQLCTSSHCQSINQSVNREHILRRPSSYQYQRVLQVTSPHALFLFLHRQPGTLYLNIFAQASTKVTLLPVCFYCLVTLRQRLWFVSTILALYKFVCMYVCY